MATVRELEIEFHRYAQGGIMNVVATVDDAQGAMFLCPLCYVKNGGSIGTHSVLVSFANRGVKDDEGSHNKAGKPTRWNVSGGVDDLTLTPSIIESGCKWHGFVTKGSGQ